MSLDLKEHYDKIYTFCYFKVHNQEIAEDITQETLWKAIPLSILGQRVSTHSYALYLLISH